MSRMARLATVAVACALVAPAAASAFKPPPLSGHVINGSGQISGTDSGWLDSRFESFRKKTGFAIVAFVVPALGNDSIEDIAYATFNEWKIGDAGKDNGVLIVIAPAEHKVRIETGKGVGGLLTDLQSNEIIRTEMVPLLKQGKVADAIGAGADAIEAALLQDALKAPVVRVATKRIDGRLVAIKITVIVLVIVLAIGCIVSSTFRRGVFAVMQVIGVGFRLFAGIFLLFG